MTLWPQESGVQTLMGPAKSGNLPKGDEGREDAPTLELFLQKP